MSFHSGLHVVFLTTALVSILCGPVQAQTAILFVAPGATIQTRHFAPSPGLVQVQKPAAEGFTLRSADGQYQLRIRGYIHSDARFLVSGSSSAASTFLLRRVRPILEARVFERFDLRLMPDFGDGRTTLQDAYIDARFTSLIRLRAGKFKSPFGLERLTSATDIVFPERSAPTLLAPNRDIGLMAHGESAGGRVSYGLALMNGVADGASGDSDEGSDKDLVGRLAVRPFTASAPAAFRRLVLAAALSAGRETGRASTPLLAQYRTAGQQVFFRLRSDGTTTGTAVAGGERIRTSIQGHWYTSCVGIVGERTSSSQDLAIGADVGEMSTSAWMLMGVSVLSGEPASNRAIVPRQAFDPGAGHWGAFEVTARASNISIDNSVFPLFADPAASARSALEWAVGVNWYLNRAVKFSTSFHQTQFDGGAVQDDRPIERLVLSRIQFAF